MNDAHEMKKNLPYIDNAKAVAITLAVNLCAVFIFNWPGGITYSGVLWDSLFCAVITVGIDMWIVYAGLRKMRARGAIPANVPESVLMRRLPQNPITLGGIYAAAFAALAIGFNAALLWFFGIGEMTFAAWIVYKLIYATALSVRVVEFCIFRYVQPDWASVPEGANIETGNAEGTGEEKPVKNPLPKISLIKEIYGSVTGNIAMNFILGSVFGGVAARADGSVIINPTTLEGIPITGLIFGLIIGVLVTKGIIAEMNKVIAANPAMIEGAVADKRFSWMPVKKGALTRLACACVMVFSAVALPSIMSLFGIPFMNFYQYTVFMTVYATLVGKALSYVLMRRCLQPDYIKRILGKD
jgi:hypothetical protein